MTTRTDYDRALARFGESIAKLGDAADAVFLYGSMAREELVPGRSDLDFWVVLGEGVLTDEASFRRALATMIAAGRTLVRSGVPVVHAFCYAGFEELQRLPAGLVVNLADPRSSAVIHGRDMRLALATSAASQRAHRDGYFRGLREHVFLPLAAQLGPEPWTEAERARARASLKYVAYVPEAACAAMNRWPGELDAREVLAATFPTLELSALDDARRAWRGDLDRLPDHELRDLLRAILSLNEDLDALLHERTGT